MIKVSLRTKLLLMMTSLLMVAVFSYLMLAVHLFNQDKSTYIFEGNATLVNTLAAETTANFHSLEKTLELIVTGSEGISGSHRDIPKSIVDLIEGEDEIVHFALLSRFSKDGESLGQWTRESFAKEQNVNEQDFAVIRKKNANHSDAVKVLRLIPETLTNGVPVLAAFYTSPDRSARHDLCVFLRQDRRFKLFSRSETFTTFLTDKYGHIIAHPDSKKVIAKESVSGADFFNQILANKFETGVRATSNGREDIILAFSKIPQYDLIVISEIAKKKAFLASQKLIEKSVLFALLIISIAFVVTVLFSKQITSSLTKLYQATLEIMRGNFLVTVNVKSSDEVGALSLSFNKMAGEISRLMQETADKARMEKELETAQLVQDNFFPVDRLDAGDFGLAAYYKPASECGGDWWGHIEVDGKLVILIGDATGHGVPSALITAAAQSCCTTLEALKRDFPTINLSPGLILEKLNNAICRASRGTVKMTFFCGVIDLNTGSFHFANASHEMPFLCKADQQNLAAARQKKDVTTCSVKPGYILGHELGSRYEEASLTIQHGELLLFYTDGLVENKNRENQMYGKGRLLRNIYKNAHEDIETFRDLLMKDALGFYQDRAADDDVTLVVIKRK